MGVWIEIPCHIVYVVEPEHVTPCVGVWIEILPKPHSMQLTTVTPCVGVWIEICKAKVKQ